MRADWKVILICLIISQFRTSALNLPAVNEEIRQFIDCNVNMPLSIVNLDTFGKESTQFSFKLWKHLILDSTILAALNYFNIKTNYE